MNIILIGVLMRLGMSCSFNGLDSGKCIAKGEAFDFESFCDDLLSDYICVPIYQVLFFLSQEMWQDWTLLKKDLEVERRFVNNLAAKIEKELDASKSNPTFTRKPSCLPSYKKFTCLINYPPCDPNSKL